MGRSGHFFQPVADYSPWALYQLCERDRGVLVAAVFVVGHRGRDYLGRAVRDAREAFQRPRAGDERYDRESDLGLRGPVCVPRVRLEANWVPSTGTFERDGQRSGRPTRDVKFEVGSTGLRYWGIPSIGVLWGEENAN